ncbi:DUF1330 domain-containing protein [Embleya sp. NPDC001921]
MSVYAIAQLNVRNQDPEIQEYIERIQATMDPFEARFIVHGGKQEVVEGTGPDYIVVLEFRSMDDAHAWYGSDAYQAILPYRTNHIDGSVVFVEGVPDGYRPGS